MPIHIILMKGFLSNSSRSCYMSYCSSCGSEIATQNDYCSECGAPVDDNQVSEREKAANADPTSATDDSSGIDAGRGIISGFMGIIVGAIGAFGFSNIGGGSIIFFLLAAGSGYFIYTRQESKKLATGMGLYLTAILAPLSPILFYIPLIGGSNTETAAGAGAAIGGILGIFIYGVIGLILGIVLFASGYLLRKGERA